MRFSSFKANSAFCRPIRRRSSLRFRNPVKNSRRLFSSNTISVFLCLFGFTAALFFPILTSGLLNLVSPLLVPLLQCNVSTFVHLLSLVFQSIGNLLILKFLTDQFSVFTSIFHFCSCFLSNSNFANRFEREGLFIVFVLIFNVVRKWRQNSNRSFVVY